MKSRIFGTALVLATACLADGLLPAGDSFYAPGNLGNFGTSPTINVGGAGAYRGLIQFDLATLPPGTTAAGVAHANLILFVNKLGAPGAVDINAASGAWTEGAVTGANAPSIGMTVATGVPVTTAGVYMVVDATAVVKAWLGNNPANQGLVISANGGAPGTSVFFDSKESASTSHSAMLEISMAGSGGIGPAGPQGPQGPAGPQGMQGPAGPARSGSCGGFYQRTSFTSKNVSPAASAPDNLATLNFTPPVSGTAVLSSRGWCLLTPAAQNDNRINLVAGATAGSAFTAVKLDEWGIINLPLGSVSGFYELPWTSESTMPVVANTAYSISLFARHELGNLNSECSGSFSVRVY